MANLERAGSAALPDSIDATTGTEDAADAAREWSPIRRILFRFAFAYLVLYNLPFPLDVIPQAQAEIVRAPYENLWNTLVPWVGKLLFGVDVTVRPNGSGDTTYNYVQVFCFLVLALAAALVWTLLDRKRRSYDRLYEWLRVYVRLSLATTMLSYGAYKVVKSQFAMPSLEQLLQPFGSASPMGLLWNFMGASDSYTIFSGAAEMLGGFLLAARRTQLLGALVSLAAMANVLMLNLSYDVPVKLYSAHLLAMAVFLTLPDLRRLASFFLFNRRAEPAELQPLFPTKRLDRWALVLRTVFILYVAGMALYQSYESSKEYGDLMPKPPLHGIWEVEEFRLDGAVRPPLLTDATRWRRMIFDYPDDLTIHHMDDMSADSKEYLGLKVNPSKKRLLLSKYNDPKWRSALSYRQPGPGLLVVEGKYDGHVIHARLRRFDEKKFFLISRGFHWINERPFNR
jgi:hypothetical protein